MKLLLKSTNQEFNLPREIGMALIAITEGKLIEVPRVHSAPKFNPQMCWGFSHGVLTNRLMLKGHCATCGRDCSAITLDAARTMFLTHCGVAKDVPPPEVLKEFAHRLEAAEPPVPPIERERIPAGLVPARTVF